MSVNYDLSRQVASGGFLPAAQHSQHPSAIFHLKDSPNQRILFA
jgi:hypothetical protein